MLISLYEISFIILLILMISVIIFWTVDFKKNKVFKLPVLKICVLLILVILLSIDVPYIFLHQGMNTDSKMYIKHSKDSGNAEQLYKLSVKTSVLPFTKADAYLMSAIHYVDCPYRFEICPDNVGQKAVENYIKAFDYSSDDKQKMIILQRLCELNTYKGDRLQAVKVCKFARMQQTAADNYVLEKDYVSALKIMDEKINGSSKVSCYDYAARGDIHRRLGQHKLSEEDFASAKHMCPKAQNIKQLYENENYVEKKYAERKKLYKF